ncbi:MAG: response regulator [Burkholderiales bacterium]|jgi:CheY-like chemotaxis protein|nr:response regulator [Burkholderiales bacterium]
MPAELRILVIDDEIDSATSLTTILQSLGHRTTCAFGGEMGTRIAQLFRPHLVFIDLAMPGSGGCEVLSEIRRALAPEDEPMFICLTGDSSEEAEARCREAGFHRFVRKPMPAQDLLEILAEATDRATRDADGLHAAHVVRGIERPAPPQPA